MKKLVTRLNFGHLILFSVLMSIIAVGLLSWGVVMLIQRPSPVIDVTQQPVSFPASPVNNFPDNLPVTWRTQHWVRIDTPEGYPLIMRACLGSDGVYVTQYGAVTVVPKDPECLTPDPPAKPAATPKPAASKVSAKR